MSVHTVLLADESTTTRRIVELSFPEPDVHVVTVSDGDEAIARLAHDPPDLVLADIALPKRSGFDVATYVRARPELSHIPVVLLAGALDTVDVLHSPFFNAPPEHHGVLVVTIHDVSFVLQPEFHTEANRLHCLQGTLNAALYAERIIAVSEQTKRDLIDYFAIPQERIRVIHEAPRSFYAPDSKGPRAAKSTGRSLKGPASVGRSSLARQKIEPCGASSTLGYNPGHDVSLYRNRRVRLPDSLLCRPESDSDSHQVCGGTVSGECLV